MSVILETAQHKRNQNKATQKRGSKFYNDPLNTRLRHLMDTRKTKTADLAGHLGVTESGVRGWCTGFSRPDIDKIAAICKYFDVTSDYLLGLTQSDGSLMELLYNDRERRKEGFRNDLADIYNLADSLISRLRWLRSKFEDMED